MWSGVTWVQRCFGACSRRAWMLGVVWLALLPIVCAQPARATADAVVVIVNKNNPNRVDRAFVVGVYTGSIKGWPNGWPVQPLDLAETSEARKAFATDVLQKRLAALGAIWSQNIFTGKGLPPRKLGSDQEMLQIVESNRNAIGYVLRSELDHRVRALDL